jgi:hypothetical protein
MFRFIKDINKDLTPDNLLTEIQGPSYDAIRSNWKQETTYYIAHAGDKEVSLGSYVEEHEDNTKHSLRNYLFVKILVECEGRHKLFFRERSFRHWKRNPINLGNYKPGDKIKVTFKFFAKQIPEALLGRVNSFDFEFGYAEPVISKGRKLKYEITTN